MPDSEPHPQAVSVTAVSTPGSRLAMRRRRLAAACTVAWRFSESHRRLKKGSRHDDAIS
jgi:hypothetical protein